MDKIKRQEYARRKLPTYRKARQRKKIAAKLEGLFLDYHFRRAGITGLMWAVYCEEEELIKHLVYNENPFLRLVPKNGGFEGKYIPVPLKYGKSNE